MPPRTSAQAAMLPVTPYPTSNLWVLFTDLSRILLIMISRLANCEFKPNFPLYSSSLLYPHPHSSSHSGLTQWVYIQGSVTDINACILVINPRLRPLILRREHLQVQVREYICFFFGWSVTDITNNFTLNSSNTQGIHGGHGIPPHPNLWVYIQRSVTDINDFTLA